MRVNIYAEEMPKNPRLEIIEKVIDGHTFTALRIYLELPATANPGPALHGEEPPRNVQGPFIHRPGDDDSAAVTFWGKRDLRITLRKALGMLDQHYAAKAEQRLRNNPVVGTMTEAQAERILAEMREEDRRA